MNVTKTLLSVVLVGVWMWSSSYRAAAAPFVRGDSNLDSLVDLSDAVATLGFLFLGIGGPACQDSMDANDDGFINMADAVHSLVFLFLGTPPIPEPYPGCGEDPTEDALPCPGSPPCPGSAQCLDQAALERLVEEKFQPVLCLPSPLVNTVFLGSTVLVCPPGSSVCPGGSSGCPFVFASFLAQLDLANTKVSLDIVGDVSSLVTEITPLFGSKQTCDFKVAVDGVIDIPFAVEPQPDGSLKLLNIGDPQVNEAATQLTFSSNAETPAALCQTLLDSQDLLTAILIAELQPALSLAVSEVISTLNQGVLCGQ